ncbi:MAG: c-type cytochrome [Planctomycetes bacterium]|nr:c-type cytochrome [Planctomycetota bacterium]
MTSVYRWSRFGWRLGSRFLDRVIVDRGAACAIGVVLTILASLPPLRGGDTATPADRIRLPDGFLAELLYSVPFESQGSWVSLTVDPKGRVIASDQYGKLYRITPPAVGAAEGTRVERLSVDSGMAHGLLYAFDSLYVVVGEKNQGLYRLRDTDGDDQFDEVKLLRKLPGGGEHGPHSLILAPDGKSLYLCAGNHTNLPPIERSLVPRHWQEDQLLPRMWDAGGHAVGRMAPGGWICRIAPDGSEFELVSNGFRNEFDIAFHADGELFTYDADMEWDIGSPWYRPTRVCHVTAGSEFGWRSGTGKWPDFYPDSLPASVNIGPGSPTGMVFGYGARFPAKYQNALFIADWSFGTLYAVHLQPSGSSYRGDFEAFATASPLAITDVVVNPVDGALYFATGGRRTQSGLYRVVYQGSADTSPQVRVNEEGRAARDRRRRIESLYASSEVSAIDEAWAALRDEDRFIRFAARTAVEHRPVDAWRGRVAEESHPDALIAACVALARCGEGTDRATIVRTLERLAWESLSPSQRLDLLRAYGLAFARLGPPTDAERSDVLQEIDARFPSMDQLENQELCRLLVYLESPGVAKRTLDLLREARTQEEQVHYVYCLRALEKGWEAGEREAFFGWFPTAGQFRGGHSFSGFLTNMRTEAVSRLSPGEKESLGAILDAPIERAEPASSGAERAFVRKWTVEDLLPDLQDGLKGRDFGRGKRMFADAACFKCHRFQRLGGIVGPDLTAVGRRFDYKYLLESLVEPSKTVSDQYQATVFVLTNGKTVTGRVANLSNDRLMVVTDMLDPGRFADVRRGEIESQHVATVSMMPNGLVDSLSRDEILDLLAFLRSGGDPAFEAFEAFGGERPSR